MSKGYLSELESGQKGTVGLDVAERVADAIGCSIYDLLAAGPQETTTNEPGGIDRGPDDEVRFNRPGGALPLCIHQVRDLETGDISIVVNHVEVVKTDDDHCFMVRRAVEETCRRIAMMRT